MKTSKVNCKHQKSIANSKIWTQFWEKIAISFCFCCCSSGKRREIRTMNLRIHATLRYWTFSLKGNVHKSPFGLCSLAQSPIKGSGTKKQRPQNFYEYCDLRKEYIYAAFLDFWRRRWISNRLMGVPIDFHWLQLTLLNPHDSLQVK